MKDEILEIKTLWFVAFTGKSREQIEEELYEAFPGPGATGTPRLLAARYVGDDEAAGLRPIQRNTLPHIHQPNQGHLSVDPAIFTAEHEAEV